MSQTIHAYTCEAMKIAVNFYLIQTDVGYFLIDSGLEKKRDLVLEDLQQAGCQPGQLKLILLTHGDFDHTGNCVYLRDHYGAKIAMHRGDLENVQSADMFKNKSVPTLNKFIARMMLALIGFRGAPAFTPDIFLEDRQDLSGYGLDAKILYLPGHSKGSIGLLTHQGDLFCGDLLENTKSPAINSLRDDAQQIQLSAARLNDYPIQAIYPGHGASFTMQDFLHAH